MMELAFEILILVINFINGILHGVGIYLLACLYQNHLYKVQQIYLINLSISEFLLNFIEAIKRCVKFTMPVNANNGNSSIVVGTYLQIIQATSFAALYYIVMIYLTLDRLFDIFLNIKYPIYWNEHKAKHLLYGTWFTANIVAIIICLVHKFNEFPWQIVCFKYFYPIIDFVFLVIAIFTYCFIYFKYTQQTTRVHPIITGSNRIAFVKISNLAALRRSKFHIPILLILTFLIFVIIADLTYFFVAIVGGNHSDLLLTICLLSYCLSNTADAFIYIFMQRDVRRLLWKKICFRTDFHVNDNTAVGMTKRFSAETT